MRTETRGVVHSVGVALILPLPYHFALGPGYARWAIGIQRHGNLVEETLLVAQGTPVTAKLVLWVSFTTGANLLLDPAKVQDATSTNLNPGFVPISCRLYGTTTFSNLNTARIYLAKMVVFLVHVEQRCSVLPRPGHWTISGVSDAESCSVGSFVGFNKTHLEGPLTGFCLLPLILIRYGNCCHLSTPVVHVCCADDDALDAVMLLVQVVCRGLILIVGRLIACHSAEGWILGRVDDEEVGRRSFLGLW